MPRPVEEVRGDEARDTRAEEPGGLPARPSQRQDREREDRDGEACADRTELRPIFEHQVVGEEGRGEVLIGKRGGEKRLLAGPGNWAVGSGVDRRFPHLHPAVGEARDGLLLRARVGSEPCREQCSDEWNRDQR